MSMTEMYQDSSPSLRQNLLAGMGAMLALVLLLLGLGVWSYAQRAADHSYDRLLAGASLSILERVQVHNSRLEVDIPYSALGMLGLAPRDRVFYQLLGPDNGHLTGYNSLPRPKDYQPSNKPQFYNAHYGDETLRFVIQSRLLTEPNASGWVQIILGQTRTARNELSQEIMFGALAILVLVMVLALGCVWFAINRALTPLHLIRDELQKRASTDLTPLHISPPREVSPLVQAINVFMTRLRGNLDAMQMFIADAAHQIRTPLSTLQAQLDLAQHESDSQLRQRLEKVRELHLRLTRLTNQLLAHALVVHRADTQLPDVVELDTLLEQVLTESVRDHAHTDVEFAFDNSLGPVRIYGDAISLREALHNLLDNAIKYGPATNLISLQLQAGESSEWVEVWVDDQGPGIPEEQQHQALQRFARLQQGRSGSGLGLAIAQAVADAHGGRLYLHNLHPGLRVRLCLRRYA